MKGNARTMVPSAPPLDNMIVRVQVTPIIDDVKQRGDAAVKEYTARFDGVEVDPACIPIEVCFPLCAYVLLICARSC